MSKEVKKAEANLRRAWAISYNMPNAGYVMQEAISALIDAKLDEKKIQFLKEEGTVLLEYGK